MHTGNVENGDAFQGDAAEVQSHAIALLEEEEEEEKRRLTVGSRLGY